jgi:hypothetical protein
MKGQSMRIDFFPISQDLGCAFFRLLGELLTTIKSIVAREELVRMQTALRTAVLSGLLLAGCTSVNPTEQVGVFAEATRAYSSQAADAYQDINSVTVERRIADLATENNSTTVGSRLVDERPFEPFLEGADLGTRLELLQGLGNYAQGLSELTTADFKKEIDAAAQELGGAFKSLSGTVAAASGGSAPLSDVEAGAVTAAVSAFGNAIAEQKRRAAIKEVVIKFNPIIQDTSRLLAAGEWSALSDLQGVNYEVLYTEDVKAYQAEQGKLSNAQRRQRLQEISRSYAAAQSAKHFFEDLQNSAIAVGTTHQALYDAVSSNRFSSEELANQIADLSSLVQSLSAFRARLPPQS